MLVFSNDIFLQIVLDLSVLDSGCSSVLIGMLGYYEGIVPLLFSFRKNTR